MLTPHLRQEHGVEAGGVLDLRRVAEARQPDQPAVGDPADRRPGGLGNGPDVGRLRTEEARTDAASIKAYELKTYYHGQWRAAYQPWVDMLAGEYQKDGGVVRDAQARLSDMIETQPVAYELDRLQPPVSLIVGELDRTAFRADTAPEAVKPHIRTVP